MRTNPGVLGIHLEGPFISAERPGVHRAAAIRAPTEDDMALLTSLAAGATLVTLAPESVPKGFVRRLAEAGVLVSLGHSMATYEETRAGARGRPHRLHASLQRDAPARLPRARPDRRSARSAGVLVRTDRRRLPCPSGDAAPRAQRRRPSDARDRRDAAGRRKKARVRTVRRGDRGCGTGACNAPMARLPGRRST